MFTSKPAVNVNATVDKALAAFTTAEQALDTAISKVEAQIELDGANILKLQAQAVVDKDALSRLQRVAGRVKELIA